MTINEIKKVLVIGNGSMSQHIAVQCAIFGTEAAIYVRNPKKNAFVNDGVKNVLSGLITDGLLSKVKAEEALERITLHNDVQEVCRGADLVSESVSEEVGVKLVTWKKFAPYLPENAILTTNTSSLLPSMFSDASGAPDRFMAWHFHLTVFRQNLADIMPHPGTDPKYVEVLKDFTKSIHQNYCIMKREYAGYLANSMLFVVLDKALDLYLAGAADFIDIDKAWMTVRIENSGPFAIMDKIGLDVMLELLPESKNKKEKIKLLEDKIGRGELGLKSGGGFYTYPNPVYSEKDFVVRPKPVL